MKRLLIAAAGLLVLAMAVLVIGGAGTSAQEGDGPVGTFLGKVAEKLGISEDELTTAIKDARLEMVDEAVAEGRLSEDQAAKIKERIESGEPGFGFGFHFGVGPRFHAGFHLLDTAAEVLGMEKADLIDALREDGATLASVAEDHGKSADTFKTELLAKVKENLDAKVADGTITQDRADNAYSNLESHIDDILSGSLPVFHRHGGHRGFGPWGDKAPEATPEATPDGTGL
jgi:ribosomal protein S20